MIRSAILAAIALLVLPASAGASAGDIVIAGATVVTMDEAHRVVPNGHVLVRGGRIAALWRGDEVPAGVELAGARVVEAGPGDLLFPGLVNLHSHPSFNVLHTWPAPASHAIPAHGKAGGDPYANRYQWGGASPATAPVEHRRLVTNAARVLGDPAGLGLAGEIVKYAEVAALLGGETAIQGAAPHPESDGVLIRNVDNAAFDTRIARPRVGPIDLLGGAELADLSAGLAAGAFDAWMVHLAEGVRDDRRRPGDPHSSRAELDTLAAKGLLTDATVVIHGTALDRADFARMRSAPAARSDGVGDERGAKLVWSPLSNLLLYGETTRVYDALAEDVLVSLGTDWTPSGSRTLLQELKVADRALRDPRVLGAGREQVAALAVAGRSDDDRARAERALDRALVDMVTRNPALSLRWYDRLGSVEPGKLADLLLIRRPPADSTPSSVYRALIAATERDVRLVLVGGDPLAGDTTLMRALKPFDHEIVASPAGGYDKAVDVTTTAAVPEGTESLAALTAELEDGLTALGGDSPPAGGGPGPPSNTYGYLKANVAGGAAAGLPDAVFRQLLAAQVGVLPDGSLNLERIQLQPLIAGDDDFLAHLLAGRVDPFTGLLADLTPPFGLYAANLNHIGPLGNPLAGLP